jgi:hypothetical protein
VKNTLFVGLVIGYMATKRWQRKLDELQLAIYAHRKGWVEKTGK